MEIEVDHYAVLDLPSGEQGAKLSASDISKAYKKKALVLHPDKRPLELSKADNFIRHSQDEKAMKLFGALFRVKRQKIQCQSQQDSKRRKIMSDLDARERAAFASDAPREEEERIARKLKDEIA
ncbi:hypothetical protein K7X08_002099 [Anisodus acutangulus]|uniref:J domain-containing protein n=1 Tax=Anisodus acutangulus TaxID=402998 RepID=A0A9Q1LSW4_9SOLA|nr:hypothetical protein K7X08_002099 [Anisodus acutangulus]